MEKSARINSATSNIPTAYSTAAGSLFITGIVPGMKGISIRNTSSTAIGVCVSHPSSTSAPGATDYPALYVEADSGIVLDRIHVGKTVYVRSEGSAISSGIVSINVWKQD